MNNYIDAKFTDLNAAAADYLGNGAIFVPEFQPEIVDIVRRGGVLGRRLNNVRATGHPTRYFEQTAIGTANFTDPRTISTTLTGPTRAEKSAMLKAVTAGIDFGLFDVEVTAQQSEFAYLVAKDLKDMVNGLNVLHDKKLWNGNDTSLTTPTTVEYMGLLSQITSTSAVAKGASVVDAIRRQIATMVANETYDIKPSAIYMNPVLLDELEKEVKNAPNTFKNVLADLYEVVPGVQVRQMITAAGLLPVIPEPYLLSTTSGADTLYPVGILTENLIEYHYVTAPEPRVFILGKVSDLATKYRAVKFGAPIAKGASYAHNIMTVTR